MKTLKWACLAVAVLVALLVSFSHLARAGETQGRAEAAEAVIDPRPALLSAMSIPGRAVLCGLNGWLASIYMAFSAGMRYADAAEMMEEGCSGPWVVTPEMIDQSRPPKKETRSIVWELDRLR